MSLSSEQALLGAVLAGFPDLHDCEAQVRPEDFHQPAHEDIWRACLRVRDAGGKVDPLTVRAALGDVAAKLPGGPVYLSDLMQRAHHVLSAPTYAAQVADQAGRRRLRQVATHIDQLAESDKPLPQIIDAARSRLDKATLATATQPVNVGDVLPDVLDIAEKGRESALSTGWPDLDRYINGLTPGRLVVVGSRPGVGKSLMGTNLARHVAYRHGHTALVCSLEMPKVEVTQRIVAAHTNVSLSDLEHGTVTERNWTDLAGKTGELMSMPIVIEDDPNMGVSTIRAILSRLVRTRTVALVVVDYLQLLKPSDSRANRAEQVGEMSRGLKQVAREFGVCVVAMAQVNRAATHRTDGEATLADLRESGSIEADADVVVLLNRQSEDSPEIRAYVAKNRSGPRGYLSLRVMGHYAVLASVERTA